MENIYVHFEDMIYQQMYGIPIYTNCVPLIENVYLYCYEKDFMSTLHISKKFDLLDIFYTRRLDDILTIDNSEFDKKNIADIYPAELADKQSKFMWKNLSRCI